MTLLIVGIIVFLGIHALPMNPGLRAALVGRWGETGYKVLFSLLSIAASRTRRSFRSGRRPVGRGWWRSS